MLGVHGGFQSVAGNHYRRFPGQPIRRVYAVDAHTRTSR